MPDHRDSRGFPNQRGPSPRNGIAHPHTASSILHSYFRIHTFAIISPRSSRA
jgi:hypothetical protein